jgi:hypothetical protein
MNVIKIKSFLVVDCLLIMLVILNRATAKNQRRQYRAFDTIEKTWRGV